MFATSKDNKTNEAKDNGRHDGSHPLDDVVAAARHLHDQAQDAATAVKDDLEGAARRTGHEVRELADSAGHTLSGLAKAVTITIREKPVQSSAVALGICLVIGLLFNRR